MLAFAKTSIRQNIGVLVVVLAILVGGTWAAVKFTTDYLLYQDATSAARHWAQYLAEGVTDLEQIAAGEQPSAASMAFFEITRRSGQVFRYEILNRSGYAQLVSDRDKISLIDLSELDTDAARSMALGRPIVDAKEGKFPGLPSYFARAYVPVIVDNRAIAIVAAYVDQTEERDAFSKAFLIAAASLCLLTGLSFVIPAVAWYWRTKEKQQADRRIRYLAHHDVLTGLTNRGRLLEKLDSALAALPLHGHSLAVHFLDLDRFKEINDTFGHDGGDFLLKTVAERLLAVTRPDDIVARLGGDEFIVVQPDVLDEGEAEAFAHRLASAIAAPVRFKDHEIVTAASIGIAIAPADGNSPERLLKSADLALYRSKADGRNCIRLFRTEMDSELQARVELEKTIRDAVVHDRFELHYQPLYEMSDRRLVGFEALIRLPRQDGTLIPPATFIPIAEEMRLIDKIGAWVLREACRSAATWPSHLTIAVNLSPAQFKAGRISDLVASTLAETGLEAHRLELEITESLLLHDSEAIMTELRRLKAMGVAIVMDDFGTGYSSLSYLWRFPFDKIKIDGSFIRAFDSVGREAETVVKTIIALGRELHMRVTVEGIETAEQVAFLEGADGDQAQGFYFGRPVPAPEIAAGILADFQPMMIRPTLPPRSDGKLRVVK
jgi:diguanylate cyclase (GGDEF)-like protein